MEIDVEVLQEIKDRNYYMIQQSYILVYIEKNKDKNFGETLVHLSSLQQKS